MDSLQSNRMFFSARLCKLPPRCWYFDWQFTRNNLHVPRSNCNRADRNRIIRIQRSTKMFQVLVQYLGDRYASFYVNNAIVDYQELLEKVQAIIPYVKQLQANQVRLAYKDLELGSFINIDPAECLHMVEMFRNAVPCGSDIYRRVELKMREIDSPFLLEKRSFRARSQHTGGDTSEREIHVPPGRNNTCTTLEPKSLAFPTSSGSEFGKISDWKASKRDQLSHKLQCLSDNKLPCCKNLFTTLVTVFLERPTRSGISSCLTAPDDHKAIISSLFSTEVVFLQLI